MTRKMYTITGQISSTKFQQSNYNLEVYDAKSPLGASAKLGVIRPVSLADFSYPINSQISFSPASCINGILFEEKLTR